MTNKTPDKDLPEFQKDGKTFVTDPVDGDLEVKLGLPGNVHYCKKCVISNQRAAPSKMTEDRRESIKATVAFDDGGICNACHAIENKQKVDWAERERELMDLLDQHRSSDGSWDVLVPGSGGKDSVYAAHMLKTKYGMNPLTITWAPHIYTDVGWHNMKAWIHVGGFDNELFTPNGQTHRILTRLAYENILHPFQPFILGQRNYPPKVAMKHGIKLVFYGESPAEYGTQGREDLDSVRPPFYYTGDPESPDIHISGVQIDALAEHGIKRGQLSTYLPVRIEDIEKHRVDCRYLGFYLKWIPQENFYYAAEHCGFEPNSERTKGSYTKYNSIDDKLDGFHYWTGSVKFGIGRCTHEAAQEIRHGHLTREEGVALVNKYDGEFPDTHFKDVLEYMDISEERFFEIADSWRSPHIWKQTNEEWKLRHPIK
jgi:N-acetyl sugar amidotransferase